MVSQLRVMNSCMFMMARVADSNAAVSTGSSESFTGDNPTEINSFAARGGLGNGFAAVVSVISGF